MTSTDSISANIASVAKLIRDARTAGADFILTPENTGAMSARTDSSTSLALPEENHTALHAMKEYVESVLCENDFVW